MASFGARALTLLLFLPVLLYSFFLASISEAQKLSKQRPFNNSISAILVFGDSTVDPGNNNYIAGTAFKSNFPPYGRDFADHIPTGRFTNGRLATDFVASYIGIKENIPPYLDPTLSTEDLVTGVSFASASSGFDPITSQIDRVISIQKQLDYFREYKRRLESAIGKGETKKLIKNAVFLVSSGTNDFVITYSGTPFRRREYNTFSSYQQFLLQQVNQFAEGLLEEGARLIGFVGLPPMGCVPVVITLSGDMFHDRRCVEDLCTAARDYNMMLKKKLKAMQIDGAIFYGDIYTPLSDMIQTPSRFGFTEANVGCCGSGIVEVAYLCNSKSYVCSDPSKYVFWDSIHPTEATYYHLFKALRPTIDYAINQSLNIF